MTGYEITNILLTSRMLKIFENEILGKNGGNANFIKKQKKNCWIQGFEY